MVELNGEKIDELLYKYIAKDYENSEHQEICSMKFYDEIEIDR